MKKLLILSIFAIVSLQGADLERLYGFYAQKQYKKACQLGLRMFGKHKKNSKFLMLYGFSCLKADYIDRLAVPLTGLRATKTERANASYFATILLQKKLLYHALLDHVDISDLKLPKTDYILSKVFDLYVKKAYRKIDDKYYLTPEQESGMLYVLYVESNGKVHKMVVEERLDGNIIKIHRYW
ncbi:hypothetical protein [Hydrogenimonas cancrithermarum]|uniref:Periplasmic protein n=1 Tax=Hydrogenimonas cancrithermarum TaxID=2993563 RepID=A0ABN6WUK8_9BACT|nr:hypothetical protein [Hydrogenimonas cancrithermarum]BDY11987.1 hypothetical protein HCR_02990 [Hydrogenimonas cancrithermarum]